MDTNTDEQRRLVRLLDTLPERLALARSNRLPHHDFLEMLLTDEGTVNLRSCGRSANHISLIGHTRPGESRTRTGENRPRIAQVDSATPSAPIRRSSGMSPAWAMAVADTPPGIAEPATRRCYRTSAPTATSSPKLQKSVDTRHPATCTSTPNNHLMFLELLM